MHTYTITNMDVSFLLQELELFLVKTVTHIITDKEECYNSKGGGFYPKTPESVTNESYRHDSSNILQSTPTRGRPVGYFIFNPSKLNDFVAFRKLEPMQCLNVLKKQQPPFLTIHWNRHVLGELLYGQLRKYVIL